jgi:hypothetical protein
VLVIVVLLDSVVELTVVLLVPELEPVVELTEVVLLAVVLVALVLVRVVLLESVVELTAVLLLAETAVTTGAVTEFTVGAEVSTGSLLQSAAAAAMLVWVLMVSAMLGSDIVVARAWAVSASATATVKAVVTENEPESPRPAAEESRRVLSVKVKPVIVTRPSSTFRALDKPFFLTST